MAASEPFDRTMLEVTLRELGRRAHAAGKVVEIAIYGGCAVMLTLNYRIATSDVDAVFEKDRDFIRQVAAEMAREFGWDRDWLNDGVKGFLSTAETDPAAKIFIGTYPSESEPGLRVFIPKPEYLFAMKCRAMRVGGAEEAMDLVQAFYPRHMIEPKPQFGLEEIFSKLRESGTAAPKDS